MMIKQKYIEIIGWYGALTIILAYALVSFKIIQSDEFVYQILNLTGALGIIVISVVKKVKQSAVLNIFWALIAAIALIGIAINR